MFNNRLIFNRRQIMKAASIFGLPLVYNALYSNVNITYAEELEEYVKKFDLSDKKIKSTSIGKHKLKMGVSGHTNDTNYFQRTGVFDFKKILEYITDGEMEVEIYGGNSICTETTCARKTISKTIDAFCASTENTASTIPFLKIMDYPFMWPSAAAMYNFWYSNDANILFRDPMYERYNLLPLFSCNEPRSIFLGKKWKEVDKINLPSDIKGAKLRVTNTELGALGLKLLGTNPVPLEWSDTLEGLNSGLIDGLEASSLSATAFKMVDYISHEIKIPIFPIFEMSFINRDVYDRLNTDEQNAVMEAAYQTQKIVQYESIHDLEYKVGAIDENPKENTIYNKLGIKVNIPKPNDLDVWIDMASVKKNKDKYKKQIAELNKITKIDGIFEKMYAAANEISRDAKISDVTPERWWLL